MVTKIPMRSFGLDNFGVCPLKLVRFFNFFPVRAQSRLTNKISRGILFGSPLCAHGKNSKKSNAVSAKGVDTPKLHQKTPYGWGFLVNPVSKPSFPTN